MRVLPLLTAGIMTVAGPLNAATDIQWWHAMGGRLGEVVEEIAAKYNASQETYNLVPTYKGGYEDTMTAGIAAFRASSNRT